LTCATIKTELVYPHHERNYSNFALIRLQNGNIFSQSGGQQVVFNQAFEALQIFPSPINDFNAFAALEVRPGLVLCGNASEQQELRWLNLLDNSSEIFNYGNYTDLKNNDVNFIGKNRNNRVVICTHNGIYFCDENFRIEEEWNSTDNASFKIPTGNINHFYQDDNGSYWLGTGDKGLIHVYPSEKKFEIFNTSNGFPNNTINIVTPDENDNLWISTDNGLVCLNKTTRFLQHFVESDGISHNEFNRGSFYKDPDGTMYFGSLNGVTVFNPNEALRNYSGGKNNILQMLGFSKLTAGGKMPEDFSSDFFSTNTATVEPGDKYFILDFSLLNYVDPGQVTYAYKIEGLDNDWIYQKEPGLKLSGIPYGKYKFLIKATLPGGTWTEATTFDLDIVTPFYLRKWFYITSLILGTTLIVGYFRWRIYAIEKSNRKLEQEVELKTKTIKLQSDALQDSLDQKEILLKEIHHRVKNNLQVINSLLEMQHMRLDDSKARIALREGQIRIMSIALIHQQLYQNDDVSIVGLKEFISNLYRQVCAVFNESKNDVSFVITGEDMNLDIETAVPLGLIFNELFTNSFKHAMNTGINAFIEVSIENQEGISALTYHDSGSGLPADINIMNLKSLGLRLIHSLSKQINGKTTYSNRNGENLYRITFSIKKISEQNHRKTEQY